jgi:tetratricopeptide (TPR) repeat protein
MPKKPTRKTTASTRRTRKKAVPRKGPKKAHKGAIQDTKAWKAAEWRYTSLHAEAMMPMFGAQQTLDEKAECLEDIASECPEFYPAVLESGLYRLAQGNNGKAEKRLEQGLQLMLEIEEPEHLEGQVSSLLDNLADLWRFDLSSRLLEPLVERFGGSPQIHDRLAHTAARMGNIEAALLHVETAVKLEPDNEFFRSNLGWVHLIAGNLEPAGEALALALSMDPDNEVSMGNLEAHRYLTRHGGTYFDYLLRPTDVDEMDRLADEEDWEEVDALSDGYNAGRMEALAQTWLREDPQKCSRLPDLLSTLRQFFRFVRSLDAGGYTLDEDISFVGSHYKAILHKFIFKFRDVDREMIEDIHECLLDYYGLLSRHGRVSRGELTRFKKITAGMTKRLIDKAERYNRIRHDDDMDEAEKEAIRDELFEGDHRWPHL